MGGRVQRLDAASLVEIISENVAPRRLAVRVHSDGETL